MVDYDQTLATSGFAQGQNQLIITLGLSQDGYTVAPSAPTPTVGGQARIRRVSDDLAMLSLVLIARRRRKRRLKNG